MREQRLVDEEGERPARQTRGDEALKAVGGCAETTQSSRNTVLFLGAPLAQTDPASRPFCMLPAGSNKLFGDPGIPRLDFLRLRSPPPKVKRANVQEVAKFRSGDQVVLQTNPEKGIAGLRSAEVHRVELADPNYEPRPITDDPEPVYLLKLDSTKTTYARTSPRWVRESRVYPRPVGVQWDAWQAARPRWNRVWEEDKEFEELAEKNREEHVKKTVQAVHDRLLKSLSVSRLLELPVSRTQECEEAVALGLRKPKEVTVSRSVSSSALRQGMLAKPPPRQKLEPIRAPSPMRRHRPLGCPRQKRVRNQIAQPTENLTQIRDSKSKSPWYVEYHAPPPYMRSRRTLEPIIAS